MAEKKYIRQRMIEIFDDYAMDKDESHFVIEMYFVKKDGSHQHKTLIWKNYKIDMPYNQLCYSEYNPNEDALEFLFKHLPKIFHDRAKDVVLSQYEKKKIEPEKTCEEIYWG